MKNLFVTYLLAGFFCVTASFAQRPTVIAKGEPKWNPVADLQTSFHTQSAWVELPGNDDFEALKFRVENAPIRIERVQVFYDFGGIEDIVVSTEMKAGEISKAFHLKNAGKDISKILFTYHAIGNSHSNDKNADVKIYGLKWQFRML